MKSNGKTEIWACQRICEICHGQRQTYRDCREHVCKIKRQSNSRRFWIWILCNTVHVNLIQLIDFESVWGAFVAVLLMICCACFCCFFWRFCNSHYPAVTFLVKVFFRSAQRRQQSHRTNIYICMCVCAVYMYNLEYIVLYMSSNIWCTPWLTDFTPLHRLRRVRRYRHRILPRLHRGHLEAADLWCLRAAWELRQRAEPWHHPAPPAGSQMKNCMPLWREARFEVKMFTKHIKTHHSRTTFGSWDVKKKCTPLWREEKIQVKNSNAQHSRTTFGSWDVKKSPRRCGTKHIQGKMWKTPHARTTLDVQLSFCGAGARDCAPCHSEQKVRVF